MKILLAASAALLSCASGLAMAQDASTERNPLTGVRAEAKVGWETPTLSGNGNVYKIESNVSYGGEVGFDVALGRKTTIGAYASYEFSSVDICSAGSCLGEEGTLSAGAKLGFLVGRKASIYGKLGYGRFTLKAKSGAAVGSDNIDGVQGALGVELALSRHAYFAVEASYGDYGELYNTGVNLQRRQLGAGIGFRF